MTANPKPAFSNGLTDAQAERLAILLEELGEAQQAIGKILRHGYDSWDPTTVGTQTTNREDLARELGDVKFAVDRLIGNEDIDRYILATRVIQKAQKIKPYLHHQEI